VKEIPLHIKLPGVPLAKQGREVAPQWEWTEAAVWTERMLATLERGIQGGKWSEMAKCLFRGTRVNLLSLSPGQSGQRSQRGPLTGELDARNSPVQFGGRGRVKPLLLPLSSWRACPLPLHYPAKILAGFACLTARRILAFPRQSTRRCCVGLAGENIPVECQ